ncbi:hypothetical protein BKA61DRAFT_27660 [Leptodontidium sp. MPI-SDFR-AT-0119]|nr:hypothetical protein BKA61DRAFT_27660 [Leptodontidium sp. MPI-SDFR-AT-0119]
MAPMVCRLKYRKGKPLSLSIYPAPTFTSLPLEIRNKIYALLLISSDPIAVYTKRSILPIGEHFYPPDHPPPHHQPGSKVSTITFSLLRVNKTISIEAAAIFYKHNIFHFRGSQQYPLVDPWDPLYSFLLTIGDRNRACLRYIEAEISRPRALWRDACGSTSALVNGSFWLREVYKCAQDQHSIGSGGGVQKYPHVHDQQYEPGPTRDYVSPAIEAVFRILGAAGSKLRILLLLGFADLPEITRVNGRLEGWSAEVPDHVEEMRRRITGDAGNGNVDEEGAAGRVDVRWRAMFFKEGFEERVGRIEEDGWDVLDVRDMVGPLDERDGFGRMGRTTCVTFRRRGIVDF